MPGLSSTAALQRASGLPPLQRRALAAPLALHLAVIGAFLLLTGMPPPERFKNERIF